MNTPSIQSVLDKCVDSAIERRDFSQALRMRWLSHANHNATLEPNELVTYIQDVRLSDGKNFPLFGK